jgi:hypothetical protein
VGTISRDWNWDWNWVYCIVSDESGLTEGLFREPGFQKIRNFSITSSFAGATDEKVFVTRRYTQD